MATVRRLLAVVAAVLVLRGALAAAPRKPVDVPFQKNYVPTWAEDHIHYINGGQEVQLYLDKSTGTGFQTRGSYLFGHFSMHIKLVAGDSAGTVTAFYLSSQNSEHDEIDFEFLGNRTGQPYILQTNVFSGGKGDREQRIYLWFDPTKDYHSYSVLWNLYMIAFLVDDTPIGVFKNSKDLGVRYPFNQPMKLYSSLWNADDWATRGGREKTDWSRASYRGFHVDGCEASAEARYCATGTSRSSGTSTASSTAGWRGCAGSTPSTTTAPTATATRPRRPSATATATSDLSRPIAPPDLFTACVPSSTTPTSIP